MLRDKVIETVKKYNLLEKGDKVVIGVSGGPDSVTLAYVLASLQSEFGISLFIAHLNHMFRPVEAEKEVRFIRETSSRLGIPAFYKHENVPDFIKEKKVSPEAGAREVRYAFFKETVEKTEANKVALGHTMDDQAETLLLNLFRGSGHTGLGAIMPRNESFIRPLIECSREEIMQYLEENSLSYCVDSSNLEPVHQRNKIRLELLPVLARDYNPNIKEVLFRTSMILQQEDAYLESQAQRHVSHILRGGKAGETALNLKEFERLAPALKPRLLREAIRRVKGNIFQISFVHITDLIELAETKPTGSSLDLPDEIVARKEYGKLIFRKGRHSLTQGRQHRARPQERPAADTRKNAVEAGQGAKQQKQEPKPVYVMRKSISGINRPFHSYRATHDTAFFDADKAGSSFFLRTRKDGDRFFPQGAKGHKKLADFFIDHKVPRDMRDKIPLLVSGGRIIWVVGYRVSEEDKVTQETKKILKVSVFRKAE